MSIQFSGLSSGLPVNDIISQLMAVERIPLDNLAKRKDKVTAEQSQYQAVASRATALRDILTKLTDAKLGTTFDIFEAKTSVSSNDKAVTASVTNDAAKNTFAVTVQNMATATKATSQTATGAWTIGASNISTVAGGKITAGTMTVYVNNQAQTVTVGAADTMQTVLDNISAAIDTSLAQAPGTTTGTLTADGKIQLNYTAGTSIKFGATGDTSNFAKLTHLNTGSANGGLDTFTAKYGTSTINQAGTLLDNAAQLATPGALAAGTITIGKSTFTIDGATTLAGLMSSVNSSQAGVLMTYNTVTNKVEMVSRSTGNEAITLNDGGTGVLQALGVTNGVDSLTSQTLGQNAKIQINGGVVLESTSNTIDSTVTGLTGVTLNVSGVTGATDATIDVKQDTDKLKSSLSDMVTKFNALLSFVDEQTKKGATLNGEASLLGFRNNLRTLISDSVSYNPTYKTLFQVGISSGAVNNSSTAASSPASTFSLDESKLLAALSANPSELKKLFLGDGVSDGVAAKLEKAVKGALDPEYGLFSSRNNAANSQIKSINDAIARGEDRLAVREKFLRQQFNAMEQLVAGLKQQQTAIAGLAARSS